MTIGEDFMRFWNHGRGRRASGGVTDERIKHHLTHYTVDTGHGAFWSVHIDSIAFTLIISFVFILILSLAARRATSGVPGKLQAAVEMLVEFVDGMVKETHLCGSGLEFISAPRHNHLLHRVPGKLHGHSAGGRAACGREALWRGTSAHGGHGGPQHHGRYGVGRIFVNPVGGRHTQGFQNYYRGEWFTARFTLVGTALKENSCWPRSISRFA